MKKYFFYVADTCFILSSDSLFVILSLLCILEGVIQVGVCFQILPTVLTSCVKMLSLHQLGLYFTQTSSARLPCDSLTGYLNKNNYTFQNNLSDRGAGTHSVLTTCPAATGCFFSVLQIIVPRWIWIKSPLCSVDPR